MEKAAKDTQKNNGAETQKGAQSRAFTLRRTRVSVRPYGDS